MDIMTQKVIMFAMVIALSYAAAKIGWLGENVRNGLSRLIIKFTAPLMIFTSISSLEYDENLVSESITIVIMSFTIVLLLVLAGKAYAKAARLDEKTKGVQVALMSFGNVAFLAYPLLESVFGPIGVFYGAFYHLANDTCFWTIGVASIDYKNTLSKKERILKIFNQNILAIFLGVISYMTRINLPTLVFQTLSELGQTTVYLSLVFLGTTMAGVDIKNTYKKLSIYVVVIFKMIIAPLAVAVILSRVYSFGLSNTAIIAVVLQISMPVMTFVAILANELSCNYKYAAETVFVTTVISLVTMPVILRIITYLLQNN